MPVRTPCGATTTRGCPCCKAILLFSFKRFRLLCFVIFIRARLLQAAVLAGSAADLQNLITTSLGFVDTFMVGMLGQNELSAVTAANAHLPAPDHHPGPAQRTLRLASQYWARGHRQHQPLYGRRPLRRAHHCGFRGRCAVLLPSM